MSPYVALTKDKKWQPGLHESVELIVLRKNEISGGTVVLRKFKTDRTIPAHTHPDANKWACVLSGDGEESDVTYDRRYAVPRDHLRRNADGGMSKPR